MAGFESVSQMLTVHGATWAHRGGGGSWPEMSEYAYEQSAAAGYGALEFSCARTSDGVWFGIHDGSINRTSQTTGLPNAREMTWAQIQQYQITLRSNGTPRPYYKMTDFLDKYAQTHVCIMDIKTGWDFIPEWFAILESYGASERIIIKVNGSNSDGQNFADRSASAGFATWGYYYGDEIANNALANTQHWWTLLGMDYTADQSAWDACLSYGKPVVGHIIPNQDAYSTALAKGATMAQVSGVAAVPAVGPPAGPEPEAPGPRALYLGGDRVTAAFLGSTPVAFN